MTTRFDVISLFPEWVEQLETYGVVGRALRGDIASLHCWNPRDYCAHKNRRIDDRPFGGGPGMVMQYAPLKSTLDAIKQQRVAAGDIEDVPVIMLSPKGEVFKQNWAHQLSSQAGGFILLCGRYEGIDQRFIDQHVDVLLSVGDVVLSGGELAAMMVLDAVIRLLPGALGDDDSAVEDSFVDGKLDHPHYTRPAQADWGQVPEVLLSGDHAKIQQWREQQALGWTWQHRPDLLKDLQLSEQQQRLLKDYIQGQRN